MKTFSDGQITQIAVRARALGDATRVRILGVLARGEQAVGQIAEAAGTQQSTASKHLQVLFHAGLVQRRRAASTVIYWIASPQLLEWCRYLGTRTLTPSGARRIESTHGGRGKTAPQRTDR
ncbi:MAG TPA: metalloregulator ArsR/SmtB family transcription factor [Vicinamibacterales bacterium]|nr:metalloregulator ArsR/SmtB family transcription factor [Vicinamibacterales bacterium]